MNESTKNHLVDSETQQKVREVLQLVYGALDEKGYNVFGQMAAYLCSEDPQYITPYNGARSAITKLEREEIFRVVLQDYLIK